MLNFLNSLLKAPDPENTAFMNKCAAYIYDRNDTCGFWYFRDVDEHGQLLPVDDVTITDV